jgi:uncharacterized protein involved in cysteine biosynthesis
VSSDTSFARMAIDAITSQLGKLVYILLWVLGLFLISLIPVINLIAPVLWVVFGSWLLSMEYFDYPMVITTSLSLIRKSVWASGGESHSVSVVA